MSYTVKLELSASDFRQNYVPAPVGASRHWLLDHAAGRDLLKTKLLQTVPANQVAIWSKGRDEELDAKLDGVIDELSLRDMPKPEGLVQVLKADYKLLVLMAKAVIGKV